MVRGCCEALCARGHDGGVLLVLRGPVPLRERGVVCRRWSPGVGGHRGHLGGSDQGPPPGGSLLLRRG